jgi:molybdopterin-guanine dinucleotide biosynthesis adapter protein
VKLIGLAGWSGAGKTTLLTKLIPHLTGLGLRVSTLKHAHHGFDVDQPGKDSHVHRQVGATEVLIASARRFALVRELRDEDEWRLADLLARLSPVDLVIVEGFKAEVHPKIEVHRAANGKPFLFDQVPHVVAIASDVPAPSALPSAHLDDIAAIAALVQVRALPVEVVLSDLRGTGRPARIKTPG